MSSEPHFPGAPEGATLAGSGRGPAIFALLALAVAVGTAPAAGQGLPVDAVCHQDSAHRVEAALDIEVEDVDARGGATSMDDVQASRTGCALEAEAGRYEVAMVTDNAVPYWDALVARMKPAAGWQEGLDASGLRAKVDTLVVEDDELILRVGESSWFFGFGMFGPDPTEGDRRRLVEIAAEVVGEVDGDPPSATACDTVAEAAGRVFGTEHDAQPGMGGALGGSYQYRLCRLEPADSDLELEVGVGGEATFEGRRPSGLDAPPRRLDADVGDRVLAWRDELMVRVGDRVFILSGRTDAGDVSPETLVPLAELLAAAAERVPEARSPGA